ncbi:unnamed protein product [Tilletia controversa]|uniref:Heme haloperoxidase family profile domain-containing protein n=3 Tax=Tilletia TaxID=13289 RepID=A0A8X7SUX7_9BASI|nr:hypothetical protein CF336_g7108 [Tilletia laevis]KAE8188861.1 hypothetical protein CF328_g6468 [Tilletia controversa]KAE8251417.1 hypothetical protein A4X03_0g6374 [Tilletia caries]KAE8190369.1 hypothetical protein CF335_g6375 [Tilletia laevis]KAE8242911.1 hypothetical protein A4X06_0g6683 [Tilletia controversa]
MRFLPAAVVLSATALAANAFPHLAQGWEHRSLSGMSAETVEYITARQAVVGAFPAPSPQTDTSSKLVNDASHPYKAPRATDQRGPCPGLNTLANHGYLNRTGIVSPQDIVKAVQAGYNMAQPLASFLAFGAHLVDGNFLSNLMSIGGKSSATGQDPPAPATVGGLNTHGLFEGDASTTRGDAQFGDNHSFNETLFQVLVSKSKQYGAGKYNLTAAAEVRWARIQDSIARNPNFDFTTPRFFTAYGESSFPLRFFVDGRDKSAALDMTTARLFFQNNTFPANFYRRSGELTTNQLASDILQIAQRHYIQPGSNQGAGNYVVNQDDPGFSGGTCGIYNKHVSITVPSQYPVGKTSGALLTALKINLHNFYLGATNGGSSNCPELFPYGQ